MKTHDRLLSKRRQLFLIDRRQAGRPPVLFTALSNFSRRSFLAGAISSPLVGAAASSAGTIRIDKIERKVVFHRNGRILFMVDPRDFAPAGRGLVPHVSLTTGPEGEVVTLSRARVRGIGLPLELTIKVRRTQPQPQVEFAFQKQGWTFRARLEDWLAGARPASGRAEAGVSLIQSEPVQVRIRRGCWLSFGPDWLLEADGRRCGALESNQGIYEADELAFSLVGPDNDESKSKRAGWIGLKRGRNSWPQTLATGLPSGSTLDLVGNGFDTIDVEASETTRGRRAIAVKTSAADKGEIWRFSPGSGVRRTDIDHGAIELVDLRQVSLFDHHGHHALTLANLAPEPQQILAGGLSLTVGPASDHAVEIEARGGQRTSLRVAPTLVSYHVPLGQSDSSAPIPMFGNGLIATSKVPPGASVAILFDIEPCRAGSAVCSVSASADTDGVCFREYRTKILRPADMLSLEFVFENFRLGRRDGEPRLFPQFPSKGTDFREEPRLKVLFPSQHLSEKAINQKEQTFCWDEPVPDGYLHHALRSSDKESQLVFEIPRSLAERGIPCRLESFLDWRDLQSYVSPHAIPEHDAIAPLLPEHWSATVPSVTELANYDLSDPCRDGYTSIRITEYIDVSPHKWSTWRHSLAPMRLPSPGAAAGGPVELWHTALDVYRGGELEPVFGRLRPVPVSGLRADLRTVRAIWADNYQHPQQGTCQHPQPATCPSPGPIDAESLPTQEQAIMIVSQSADFKNNRDLPAQGGTPTLKSNRAIPFDRFMLSSQGATVRLDARWDPSALTDGEIEEWKQDAVWGRDQDVLVSYRGYGDHGHRIAYIIERKREIVPDGQGGFTAALVEHKYCKVEEPILYYSPPRPGEAVEGRQWPYVKVEIAKETLVTPDLETPTNLAGLAPAPPPPNLCRDPTPCGVEPDAFIMIPKGTGAPFLFKVIYTDLDGATHVEHRPFLWINMRLAETRRFKLRPAGNRSLEDFLDAYRDPNSAKMTAFRTASAERAKITAALVPAADATAKRPPQKMDTTVELEWVTTTVVTSDPSDPTKSSWPDPNPQNNLAWPKADPRNNWVGGVDWPLRFYPAIDRARVRLQNVDIAGAGTGIDGKPRTGAGTAAVVGFHEDLRAYGLPADGKRNTASFLFRTVDELPGFKLPGGRSSGLVVPAVNVACYSATLGPVGAPQGAPVPLVAPAKPSPVGTSFSFKANLFSEAALICGAVKISDVIGNVEVFDDLAQVPKFVSEALDDIESIKQQFDEAKKRVDGVVSAVKTLSNLKTDALAAAALKADVAGEVNKYLFGTANPTLASIASSKAGVFYDNIAKPIEDRYKELVQKKLFAVTATYDDAVAQVQQDGAAALGTADELYANTLALAASYDLALAETLSWTPWFQELRTRIGGYQAKLAGVLNPWFGEIEDLGDDLAAFQMAIADPAKLLGALRGLLDRAHAILDALNYALNTVGPPNEAMLKEAVLKAFDIATSSFSDDALKTLAANMSQLLENALVGGRPGHDPSPLNDPAMVRRAVLGTAQSLITKLRLPVGAVATNLLSRDIANVPSSATVRSDLATVAAASKTPLQQYLNSTIGSGLFGIDLSYILYKDGLVVKDVNDALVKYADNLVETVDWQSLKGLADQLESAIGQMRELIAEATSAVPQEIKLHYDWTPPLKSGPASAPVFVAQYDSKPATCDIHVEITKTVMTDAPPQIEASCTLSNFSIVLLPSLPMITVGFKSISFVSHNGGSPAVDVKFGGVALSSELSFVTALQQYFLGDAPIVLDIETDRISVGYGLKLPNMTLGGLNIMQLAFYTSVVLPFDGAPTRARFSVSERNHPFLVSVGVYGGGGFFAIEATPHGIEAMEASFEFGGVAAITVGGVASGIAYAMGGVYFREDGGDVTLTGFFDAGGSFDIIGLIQLNIEFYVGLTYHNGNAFGEVLVSVEIGFAFFSITVHIHQTKTIAGSGSSGGGQTAQLGTSAFADYGFFGLLDPGGGELRAPVPAAASEDDEGPPALTREEIHDHWKTWRAREMPWPT